MNQVISRDGTPDARLTLEGHSHGVDSDVPAPVLAEFFAGRTGNDHLNHGRRWGTCPIQIQRRRTDHGP